MENERLIEYTDVFASKRYLIQFPIKSKRKTIYLYGRERRGKWNELRNIWTGS